MAWSFKLFDVAGTAVRVHFTFFLLLAWIGAVNWARGGPAEAIDGIVFILLLFACVVLHEFGHIVRCAPLRHPHAGRDAAADRRRRLAGAHAGKAAQEIVVALAGPAVNLVIALVLIVVLGARFDLTQMAQLEQAQTTLIGPDGRGQRGAAACST